MLGIKRRLKHFLPLLMLLLFASISAQRDGGAPSPPAAVSYFNTRPNFYDTKLTEAQKVLLAPLTEDLTMFADFLRQENTGLFRLHPKGK